MDIEKTDIPEIEEDDDCIILTMEDGSEKAFNFEDSFDYKEKRYLCLSPAEEMDGIGQGELLIYELKEDQDQEEGMLSPIEDDDLLEEVYKEYCKRYDDEFEGQCDCQDESQCSDESNPCKCHCGE